MRHATPKINDVKGPSPRPIKISLRLPLIGPFIIEGATKRFCRTMATLLEGGVVLNKELAISRQTVDNHFLREELLKMEERIVGGSSLISNCPLSSLSLINDLGQM